MAEYKHVGNHADDLADGRMIGPGETVELDEEAVRDPHNERLIAEGVLIGTDKEAEHEATLAERRVSRRNKQEEGGDEE